MILFVIVVTPAFMMKSGGFVYYTKKADFKETLEESPVNISAEHIKQLEDELLKLRIENIY